MRSLPTKILLATGGSEESPPTRAAIGISERTGSELHVVHAWPTSRVAVGDAAAEHLEAAEEGNASEKVLVAVGNRGLGAIRRMRLGSVSTKVLHAAKGPVLIYRHHGDRR